MSILASSAKRPTVTPDSLVLWLTPLLGLAQGRSPGASSVRRDSWSLFQMSSKLWVQFQEVTAAESSPESDLSRAGEGMTQRELEEQGIDFIFF